MKLWRLTQSFYNGYDSYDGCIVAATTAEKARVIQPSEEANWSPPELVEVELIGTAVRGTKEGVILASFNAA